MESFLSNKEVIFLGVLLIIGFFTTFTFPHIILTQALQGVILLVALTLVEGRRKHPPPHTQGSFKFLLPIAAILFFTEIERHRERVRPISSSIFIIFFIKVRIIG
jgi:hypothetical protein